MIRAGGTFKRPLTDLDRLERLKFRERLGHRLKRTRKRRGFTAWGLCQELRICDPDVIFYWESGRKLPSVYSLNNLAEVLEVSVDFLLGLEIPNEESKT